MKVKNYKWIYFLVIFIFLFIFFTDIHPVVVYDTDDWTYISRARKAIPNILEYNPAKIFPETFSALIGSISTFLVNKIINDYLRSFTISYAFVISVFIIVYLLSFFLLIVKKMNIADGKALLVTTVFLLFHFLIFRSNAYNNIHLFYSKNITCYMNYTVPTLLNSIVVMYLAITQAGKNFFNDKNILKKGIILLAVYLAIFSNLFCSIILVSYALSVLFFEFINIICNKIKIIDSVKKNSLYLLIIALWTVCLCFEAKGGRASAVGKNLTIHNIFSAIKKLLDMCLKFNKFFIITCITIMVVMIVIIFVNKPKKIFNDESVILILNFALSFFITTAFIVLLSAKIRLSFLSRADVWISISFYAFLVVFLSLAYIITKCNRIVMIIPTLIIIIFFNINTNGNTFAEPNKSGIPYEMCYTISEDILNQIKEEYDKGIYEIELHVPKYDTSDNWPIAIYGGSRIANTLVEHGIIEKDINITIVPDKSLNAKYGI